jgi:CheY-like chemotaxis protein
VRFCSTLKIKSDALNRTPLPAKTYVFSVAQTSKSAVSRVSKPAGRDASEPTWKSAIQQVWKPALREIGTSALNSYAKTGQRFIAGVVSDFSMPGLFFASPAGKPFRVDIRDHGMIHALVAQKESNMKLQTLLPLPSRDGPCATDFLLCSVPSHVPRILVVDDDECLRNIIISFLTRAGFAVDSASDGLQAWESILQTPYDLLLTDQNMPGLTGLQLVERIRDADLALPIIMISGSLPKRAASDDAQLHITALVSKPFNMRELLSLVRTALEAPAQIASQTAGDSTRMVQISNPSAEEAEIKLI